MSEKDLTSLSQMELISLFLDVNDRLQQFVQRPNTVYINDPEFKASEIKLAAITGEIFKRFDLSCCYDIVQSKI